MAKEKEVKKSVKKANVKKKETKKVEKKEKFSTSFKKEVKLVKWPTVKEIVKYTVATILFCIVLIAFFEALNILMAFIKGLFN